MNNNRERLAWTVLLVSFSFFVALLVGIPFGIYQWLQHATVPPKMLLQTIEGITQVEPPGASPHLVPVGEEPIDIEVGTAVSTNTNTDALLTINSPDEAYVLGTVQIYPNTELIISQAKSPRFGLSSASHQIEIRIVTGRVRLGLASQTDHVADIRGVTDHARFLLWEAGSYSLEVNASNSQITVREGKATVYVDQDNQLKLEETQRGVAGSDGTLTGPLRPERDLITNGHFRQPLEQGWRIRTDSVDPNQSAGTAEIVTDGGQEAVRLARDGSNHAETGIYQTLNTSLHHYRSLQLHLSGRLDFQSLGICGMLGSECPLMLRIRYRDQAGNEQDWVQGFYYWVDPAVPIEEQPTLCILCPSPRQEHEQQSEGVQFFYDSPNLMEILTHDEQPPIRIVEIAVYASGHSYDVQISEIELLVAE